MPIDRTAPISREAIPLVQAAVKDFPPPLYKEDGRKNRFIMKVNQQFKELVALTLRVPDLVTWSELCGIRLSLERTIPKHYPGERGAQLRAAIAECQRRVEELLAGGQSSTPAQDEGPAAPQPPALTQPPATSTPLRVTAAGGAADPHTANSRVRPPGLLESTAQTIILPGGREIIFDCPAMVELVKLTERVAQTDYSVLITGETGTGKDLIAQLLHQRSDRAREPFKVVNCAAIHGNLLESELFGHRRGAFTGAVRDNPGLLAEVGEGTLFLDEIGEMDPRLQAKLLRVLQAHKYRPVGGNNGELDFNGRIVSATNQDLTLAMKEGRFRPDLFYRLNEINLETPPLRQRGADLRRLITKIFRDINPPGGWELSPSAAQLLHEHSFPGNIRELETVLKRAFLKATLSDPKKRAEITREHIEFFGGLQSKSAATRTQ